MLTTNTNDAKEAPCFLKTALGPLSIGDGASERDLRALRWIFFGSMVPIPLI